MYFVPFLFIRSFTMAWRRDASPVTAVYFVKPCSAAWRYNVIKMMECYHEKNDVAYDKAYQIISYHIIFDQIIVLCRRGKWNKVRDGKRNLEWDLCLWFPLCAWFKTQLFCTCACACACVHMCLYGYIYICVCVCVCVFAHIPLRWWLQRVVGSQVHQHTANTPSDLRYPVEQYTVKQSD